MSLEDDRETVLVMVVIRKRKDQRLPDQLTDALADRAYNLIAVYGKTAEVTAQLVTMPRPAWEMA